MRLHFHGHAAVGLQSRSGERLLVDPYEPGGLDGKIDYPPIRATYDWGVATHEHGDHTGFAHLPSPPTVIRDGAAGPFAVERYTYHHDEYEGRRFGGETDILRIDVDGLTVVHAGDVGQSPDGDVPPRLRRPDVALLPVGGFYTIGAAQAHEWMVRLQAHVVIPTHFRTPQCKLPLAPVDHFLARLPNRHSHADGSIELEPAMPSFPVGSVVVLETDDASTASE